MLWCWQHHSEFVLRKIEAPEVLTAQSGGLRPSSVESSAEGLGSVKFCSTRYVHMWYYSVFEIEI